MQIVTSVGRPFLPAGHGRHHRQLRRRAQGTSALILRTLHVCREQALECVVLTFWPHPRLVLFPERGHLPLTTREERLELLAGLGVRRVLELPFTRELAALSPEDFVRRCLLPLNLRELVVGYDFSLGRDRSGHADVLRALGARCGFGVEQVPPVIVDDAVVSSTRLRDLIRQGDVWRAAVSWAVFTVLRARWCTARDAAADWVFPRRISCRRRRCCRPRACTPHGCAWADALIRP